MYMYTKVQSKVICTEFNYNFHRDQLALTRQLKNAQEKELNESITKDNTKIQLSYCAKCWKMKDMILEALSYDLFCH